MIRCPICDSHGWDIFLIAADMYTGKPYRLLSCNQCGLVRTEEDDAPPLISLYTYSGSSDAGKRFGPMQGVLQALRRDRVRTLAPGRPGRVLDVGCGDGSFLAALDQQGWDVFGTELSESIAATARQRLGDRVHVGAIEKIRCAESSFDLITFWHVLEHLDDPAQALAEARRLVKADGRIVVAVPNIESLQAHMFKEHWLHLDVPRHRWHFNPHTLATLADRCRLHVECIRHFSLEYGLFAMVQGTATKAGLGHSLFTRLMRLSPSQLVREPLFWAHVPLLAFAIAPSLLLECGAAICGRGGAMNMVLKPQ
jgi:SAM-dependent methyltransferase